MWGVWDGLSGVIDGCSKRVAWGVDGKSVSRAGETLPGIAAPTESGGAPDSAVSRAWGEAVSLLARAVQSVRLYGDSHAIVSRAVMDAAKRLGETDLGAGAACVGVGLRAMQVAGAQLELDEGGKALASELSKADVAAIELRLPLTEAQTRDVVLWLSTVVSGKGGHDKVPESVRAIPIGAHGLEFIGGGGREGGASGASWDALLYSIISGGGGSNLVLASAIKHVKAELNVAEQREREGALRLIESFMKKHGATGQSAGSPAASDTEIAGSVLTALNPRLKQSLVNLGAASGAEWIVEQAPKLAMSELAAAFVAADSAESGPPEATVQLLTKLMTLTALSQDTRGALEGINGKWRLGAAEANAAGVGTGGAVAELMTDRGVKDFCPDDYRRNLEKASGSVQAHVVTPIESGQFEAGLIVMRLADIAEWLCKDKPELGVSNHGPASWIAGHADGLSAMGRGGLVWTALDTCREVAGEPGPEQQDVIRRVKAAAAQPGVIEALMVEDGGIERLAASVPAELLRVLGERIAKGRMSPNHANFRRAVELAPPATLRAMVLELAQTNVAAVVAIVEHMDQRELAGFVQGLLAQVSDGLRAAMVGVCDRRLGAWPEALVTALLTDTSAEVVEYGVRRLQGCAGAASVEMLLGVLTGRATGRVPGARACTVLVSTLGGRGEEGLGHLAELLKSWSRGVNRERIRVCRRIATELERHREYSAGQAALKTWRRSMAHTIGLFVVEDDERAAA